MKKLLGFGISKIQHQNVSRKLLILLVIALRGMALAKIQEGTNAFV